MLRPPAAAALLAAALSVAVPAAAQRPADANADPRTPAYVPALPKHALRLGRGSVVVADASALDRSDLLRGAAGIEFERRIRSRWTLALSANHWDHAERVNNGEQWFDANQSVQYLAAEAQLRFYPGRSPMNGFWVGGGAGWTLADGGLYDGFERPTMGLSRSAPSAVAESGYGWLLGDRRNLSLTAAAGYRRVFLNNIPNVVRDHPTMRFGIGYAF